jgi:hypothetical protein
MENIIKRGSGVITCPVCLNKVSITDLNNGSYVIHCDSCNGYKITVKQTIRECPDKN